LHPTLEKEWRVAIQPPSSNLAFVIARRQQHLSELAVAVTNNRPGSCRVLQHGWWPLIGAAGVVGEQCSSYG
jgi:hypothetical protein